ncbi:MAG: pyruvate kinase, partial [Planctomycetota bacterium]
ETHARVIDRVRREAEALSKPVGILFDLQGPKIRIGDFDGPTREVLAGEEFTIAVGRPHKPDEIPADHPLLDRDVEAGDPLLIDDGQLSTEVISVEEGRVRCRAVDAGTIAPRKGINLPSSHVSAPAVTEKDHRDALFALAQGVDAIALSFVRRARDVRDLERIIKGEGGSIPIISKIEKPQALEELDEILEASWGVMVARGDLGVELSPEEVPMAQKRIISEAMARGRPVITATQMLESMTRNPRPTRAEASDVANAVLDGTDAVMLSQETATGDHAVESVRMMARIVRHTESFHRRPAMRRRRELSFSTIPDAVVDAGCQVAHHLNTHAIVAFTRSGMTALLAARRRPDRPILAFTTSPKVWRRLSLVWGVRPYKMRKVSTTDALIAELDAVIHSDRLARKGDPLVLLMGAPTHKLGRTNLMHVYRVGYWAPLEKG